MGMYLANENGRVALGNMPLSTICVGRDFIYGNSLIYEQVEDNGTFFIRINDLCREVYNQQVVIIPEIIEGLPVKQISCKIFSHGVYRFELYAKNTTFLYVDISNVVPCDLYFANGVENLFYGDERMERYIFQIKLIDGTPAHLENLGTFELMDDRFLVFLSVERKFAGAVDIPKYVKKITFMPPCDIKTTIFTDINPMFQTSKPGITLEHTIYAELPYYCTNNSRVLLKQNWKTSNDRKYKYVLHDGNAIIVEMSSNDQVPLNIDGNRVEALFWNFLDINSDSNIIIPDGITLIDPEVKALDDKYKYVKFPETHTIIEAKNSGTLVKLNVTEQEFMDLDFKNDVVKKIYDDENEQKIMNSSNPRINRTILVNGGKTIITKQNKPSGFYNIYNRFNNYWSLSYGEGGTVDEIWNSNITNARNLDVDYVGIYGADSSLPPHFAVDVPYKTYPLVLYLQNGFEPDIMNIRLLAKSETEIDYRMILMVFTKLNYDFSKANISISEELKPKYCVLCYQGTEEEYDVSGNLIDKKYIAYYEDNKDNLYSKDKSKYWHFEAGVPTLWGDR